MGEGWWSAEGGEIGAVVSGVISDNSTGWSPQEGDSGGEEHEGYPTRVFMGSALGGDGKKQECLDESWVGVRGQEL